jgi:hypothetical protein
MDIMANLLVILLYLSALYAALGLLGAGIEGFHRRLATWRRMRGTPGIQRRPRRVHPRRRIERNEAGAMRRPATAAKVPAQVLRTL